MKRVGAAILIITVIMCGAINCANILGIFHFPSPSHHILGSTLLKELARRGHQVTMISPYPFKQPIENYTDISISEIDLEKEDYMKDVIKSSKESSNFITSIRMINGIGHFTERFYEHKAVQELLNSDVQFDLIIIVWAYSEALLGVSHHYNNAPVIAFSAKGSTSSTNYLTNNPSPYSYIPCLFFSFSDEMSFLQRIVNTVGSAFSDLLPHYITHYTQTSLLTKYHPEAPPIDELLDNVALVMLNSHFSVETPRPYVPSMVQIGGFHVQEPKELPKDLKTFLDTATEGAIYFSMGGNAKSTDLSVEKLKGIISAFAKIPQKVLWKWEDDQLPDQPNNVKLGRWLPQNDILAHPNVKAFITHGGLLSTTEAIYHGVPIIGIPLFGDQKTNVGVSVVSGYGVKLDYSELNEETLTNALGEILHNPKYQANIKKRSNLMRNQPIKPMDNAVFWVEHILEHKGGQHLRTAATKLSWYQILLLDVLVTIGGIILTIILMIYFISKLVLRTARNIFVTKVKLN